MYPTNHGGARLQPDRRLMRFFWLFYFISSFRYILVVYCSNNPSLVSSSLLPSKANGYVVVEK